ncbi:SAP domain-containing protein [Oceanivirga salmonicida]|uniref:SAP domain-containing protein n=1 Tax=Oceanivirga salmonicida TaxID=1769291 RepID=UPI00082B2DDE|nr:SAP domain-containing protein [Oceanivirga salmonicida]
MNNRPDFNKSLSKEEFLKHYWYKTELHAICAKHGLPTHGTKAELQEQIINFLNGKRTYNSRLKVTKKRLSNPLKEITLDTHLIRDGFKFNHTARKFFCDYFNVKKFSFTKEMATLLRKAEKENDLDITVKELIQVYINSKQKSKKKIITDEDKTYQWNNFLKEFHKDKKTKSLNNKMLIASFLWKQIRDNPGEKIYTSGLLVKYKQQIQEISYKKNIKK